MRLWILFAMMMISGTATALDFAFENIDGGELSLSDYKGRPILVVNTASRRGFTSQLSGLQKLHETYKDQGLVVLAVPSNDFNQELGSNVDVNEFCELGYSTTMPMTGITKVKGPNAHLFFKWAKRSAGFTPSWNFNKLLIDQNGQIVKSFGSVARPSKQRVTSEIERLLR